MNDETRNAIAAETDIKLPLRYDARRGLFYDAGGVPVLQLWGWSSKFPEDIKRAEYIAKCINEYERLRGEVAEQRKRIAEDLLDLCLVCCEQPLRSFEEGNEASMGYPIMTGEECCGCPVPKVPLEVIEYIDKLRLEEQPK